MKEVENTSAIRIETIRPEKLSHFSFYQEEVLWQCSCHSLTQGEAKVFYNGENEVLVICYIEQIWMKKVR